MNTVIDSVNNFDAWESANSWYDQERNLLIIQGCGLLANMPNDN